MINKLQFWIEPGCTLFVVPRDAIMLSIRLEWTVKEFFEEDGIGVFTDRMAAALGIHKADLKVVQVYEGSVIIQFEVMTEEGEENPEQALKEIEEKFQAVVPELGETLGAPIISVMSSQGKVTPMAGYENETGGYNGGTQTTDADETGNTGSNDLIDKFLNDRDEELQDQIDAQNNNSGSDTSVETDSQDNSGSTQDQTTDSTSTSGDSDTTEQPTTNGGSNNGSTSDETTPSGDSTKDPSSGTDTNGDSDSGSTDESSPEIENRQTVKIVKEYVTVTERIPVTVQEKERDDSSQATIILISCFMVVIIGLVGLIVYLCYIRTRKIKLNPQ